jgi:hypothetical protein
VVSRCHSFRWYSFLEAVGAEWQREIRDNGKQSESEPEFAVENNEHVIIYQREEDYNWADLREGKRERRG